MTSEHTLIKNKSDLEGLSVGDKIKIHFHDPKGKGIVLPYSGKIGQNLEFVDKAREIDLWGNITKSTTIIGHQTPKKDIWILKDGSILFRWSVQKCVHYSTEAPEYYTKDRIIFESNYE